MPLSEAVHPTMLQLDFTSSRTSMWDAVVRRHAEADGAFVYAVKSTGIYCRPTCSARRPKSVDAVEFFAHPEAAEEAGYRSCLRCKPDQPGPWQQDLIRVQRTCRILECNLAETRSPVNLSAIADELGDVSAFHLQKSFKRILGISPRQYLDAVRQRNFKAMLQQGERVSVAARQAGIQSPGTLYGRKAVSLGFSPTVYRAGAPGAMIRYGVLPCPLGYMLLAATRKGVCAIMLGGSITELESELQNEYPKASLYADAATLAPFLLAALSVLGLDQEASASVRFLPLDIRATAFQWRVWLALQEIPPGAVASYSEIAAALNNPGAARAVGSACAANPVALAIPCHRAVHTGGAISGYRWGPDRKRALLRHEREQVGIRRKNRS